MNSVEKARIKLRAMLLELFDGSLYYQPPGGSSLKYPCIIYERSSILNQYANDAVYNQRYKFTITLIDQKINTSVLDNISRLPMCSYDRHFASGNLNHDVFTIYI